MQFLLMKCIAIATLLIVATVKAEEKKKNVVVEQPTESATPMTDMAATDDTAKAAHKLENATIKPFPIESQPHTIADFIIQPLIALRPRVTESEKGKQSASNSTVAFPWQIFNFSPGQSIGSSVSSLAGTVTGWLGNRIQLPSFIETPIREIESASTTTTSTSRPEIIVRIQQRPIAKRPVNSLNNSNNHSNRQRKKPKRPMVNHVDDSNEDDDSKNYNRKRANRRRYQESEENYDDDNTENEYLENDDREVEEEHNNPSREEVDAEEEKEEEYIKPMRLQNKHQAMIYNQRKRIYNQQQRQQQQPDESDAAHQYKEADDDYDDNDDDDDDEEEEEDENYYHNQAQHFNDFQNAINMIQRNQIGQFNRPQSLLFIKRNGETFHLVPENFMKTQAFSYPQTPKPHNSKPQSTPQYITIPWSQLGISAPETVKPNLATNKKKSSPTETSDMDLFKTSSIPPQHSHTIANKPTQKPFAKRPANIMEMPVAEKDTNENEDSDEQMKDDSKSQTQYFIIADESAAKPLNKRNYKQILNYFHKNRKGRQLLLSADTKEQLIPVKIVASEQKLSKTEEFNNTKVAMTSQSHLDNPAKTKLEKAEALIKHSNS